VTLHYSCAAKCQYFSRSLIQILGSDTKVFANTATIVQDQGGNLSLCETCQSCFAYADENIEFARDAGFFHGSPVDNVKTGTSHHESYPSWEKPFKTAVTFAAACVISSLIPQLRIGINTRRAGRGRNAKTWLSARLYTPPSNHTKSVLRRPSMDSTWPLGWLVSSVYLETIYRVIKSRHDWFLLDTQKWTTTIYDVGETTSSDHAWNTASKWLQDCVQNHESVHRRNLRALDGIQLGY